MAYDKDDVKKVVDEFQAKRKRAWETWESHVSEIRAMLPAAYELEVIINRAGPRMYEAALRGEGEVSFERIKEETVDLTKKLRTMLRENGYPENYLDVNYECALCSDTGYCGIEMCSCMKEALAKTGFESSGLSNLARTQSFDTFDLSFYEGRDRDRISKNVQLLRGFAENFDSKIGANWLLFGPTGLGKTHLSTSVAATVINSGHSVIYESVGQVISAYEEKRFGGDYSGDRDRKYSECDLLIIDDLGTEVTNQFTTSCLYALINERLVKNLSTIINTNLGQGEIRERYTDRIASRLFGEYMPLGFSGRDVRQQKLERQFG
ncbi:MAG: ATP-binding protein [Clostridia bacterium]|nr:ATP-binding protein [Clostridia bacterium]